MNDAAEPTLVRDHYPTPRCVDQMELDTDRLVLREFARADFAAVHSYASDPLVTQFMDWGPNTESDSRGFLNTVMARAADRPRTVFELAVVATAGGVLVTATNLSLCPWHLLRLFGSRLTS